MFHIISSTMAKVFSHQPVTMEVWVWSQASACGIYGGKSCTETGRLMMNFRSHLVDCCGTDVTIKFVHCKIRRIVQTRHFMFIACYIIWIFYLNHKELILLWGFDSYCPCSHLCMVKLPKHCNIAKWKCPFFLNQPTAPMSMLCTNFCYAFLLWVIRKHQSWEDTAGLQGSSPSYM